MEKRCWTSFLTDLEERICSESDEDEEAAPEGRAPVPYAAARPRPAATSAAGDAHRDGTDAVPPRRHGGEATMSSLYLQRLREHRSAALVHGAPTASRNPSAPLSLPLTLPLQEWVARCKQGGGETRPMYPGAGRDGIDKTYLEQAARVALSLAKQLHIHGPDAPVIGNVVVSDTTTGDVALVNVDAIPAAGAAPSASPRTATHALGRIYYEVFTQGSRPPTDAAPPPASDAVPSSFDRALTIDFDDAGDAGETRNKRKQPRRPSRERGHGHYATLQMAGVPPSLCRLIADMLEDDHASGGLFCADRAAITLADVVSDLQQMVAAPASYLHDSLILRLEPIVPDNKLYGRTQELRRCLEVADAIPRRERKSAGIASPQPAILIFGFSGSGKSSLAKQVGHRLRNKGWQYLQCKFDQEVRHQPLSTITSAFDKLLGDIVCRLDSGEQKQVRDRIHAVLEDEHVEALCQLIPTLRLVTEKPASRAELNEEISFNTENAEASKFRLHRMFGLLVRALSEPKRPLLVCMDDLQWADVASLELIHSLIEGIVVDEVSPGVMCEGPYVLFVSCFRSNDVGGSEPQATCSEKMKDCRTIKLEEIHLEGLPVDAVNTMISEALCYPRRLTRSLAHLIHQKSAGNPLFVKEFLNSIATENLLTYSLSRHRWIWDEDVIEMKAVSNGVVDLLTSRLQRLPPGVLAALEVMSCFGHDVSSGTLGHVRDVCGPSDIVAGLEYATKELLIHKSDLREQSAYSFVHDMVETTVYQGIKPEERVRLLKKIADTLIARTSEGRRQSEGRRDDMLFIIVGLINRVGPNHTPPDDRVRYAHFNLLAGEKSILTPDFLSAYEFIEYGISFLDAGHWEQEYDLSLGLFKRAAGLCSLAKPHLVTKYLNEVFDCARCYDDKLDTMGVLINTLVWDGKPGKALEKSLTVLAFLGEPLSDNLNEEAIVVELIETHDCVQQISPASWKALPAMQDPRKMKAMHFLKHSIMPSSQQKTMFFAVITCRMVRLTLSHGLHLYSSTAMAMLAYAYTTVLKNYEAGYKLGKLALALNTSPKLFGEISLIVTNTISAYKEPLQVLLPTIIENSKIALKCGSIGVYGVASACYVIRAFLSGSTLTSLNKELVVFFHTLSKLNQIRSYKSLIPVSNAIADLSGEPRHRFCHAVEGYEEEKNLSEAFKKKDISLCEILIAIQIAEHFVLRRMDLSSTIVRQYQEFFDIHGGGIEVQFIFVYRTFYSGLVAFHCFRETQDQYWMDLGRDAISKMKALTQRCKWNFENKMLLLTAEYYFSIGDFEKATQEYQLSITSAHAHRFVNEEAMANELAGYFQLKRGSKDLSIKLKKQAVGCYQSWGAMAKAKTLQSAE